MVPSPVEGTILSTLDKLEELSEEKALEFLMDRVLTALLGANPAFALVWLLRPIIEYVFNKSVKPIMQLVYRNMHAGVAIMNGKWTIRKIKQLEEEGDHEEIWNTIITNY